MAWIENHIEWVGGLVLTALGGMVTVLGFIGKAVYKDRRSVLQRVTDVEKTVHDHTGLIKNLSTTLAHEVDTAREERQQIRDALDEHSRQVREDFKRVHERTDDVFQLLTDLPTKIISIQKNGH